MEHKKGNTKHTKQPVKCVCDVCVCIYDECVCIHDVCVCIQLPVIAKSLGKRVFKRHLELFLEHIFFSLVSQLVVHARSIGD